MAASLGSPTTSRTALVVVCVLFCGIGAVAATNGPVMLDFTAVRCSPRRQYLYRVRACRRIVRSVSAQRNGDRELHPRATTERRRSIEGPIAYAVVRHP